MSFPKNIPVYPEYVIETTRLHTFEEWPDNHKQRPEQFAEAGFFYCGTGDRVRCFSCGGGLKDWENNDEPWEQHARWFSHCRYVKLAKGQLYIDAVLRAAAGKDVNSSEKNVAQTNTEDVSSSIVLVAAPAASITIPEEKLCKICYDAEYNTIFLPCGHVIACSKCASSVEKCPLCRKRYTNVMRIYFS